MIRLGAGLRRPWVVLCVAFVACSQQTSVPTGPSGPVGTQKLDTVTFSGTGDIVGCNEQEAGRLTAQLLDDIGGLIFTTGDNVYDSGTEEEFKCFDAVWGRHKTRIRPTPGNHDYYTANAAPYFAYFGEAAGPSGRGYYSFTYGAWQIYSLNSNVPATGGSAQATWLLQELNSNKARCTLAYWHHPVLSSGFEGNMPNMRDIWRMLNDFNADVVLVGHSHDYERLSPQDASGHRSAAGVREFVVGTGGRSHTALESRNPNSEAYNDDTFGILKLILKPTSYEWEFVPAPDGSFRDAGTDVCH